MGDLRQVAGIVPSLAVGAIAPIGDRPHGVLWKIVAIWDLFLTQKVSCLIRWLSATAVHPMVPTVG